MIKCPIDNQNITILNIEDIKKNYQFIEQLEKFEQIEEEQKEEKKLDMLPQKKNKYEFGIQNLTKTPVQSDKSIQSIQEIKEENKQIQKQIDKLNNLINLNNELIRILEILDLDQQSQLKKFVDQLLTDPLKIGLQITKMKKLFLKKCEQLINTKFTKKYAKKYINSHLLAGVYKKEIENCEKNREQILDNQKIQQYKKFTENINEALKNDDGQVKYEKRKTINT